MTLEYVLNKRDFWLKTYWDSPLIWLNIVIGLLNMFQSISFQTEQRTLLRIKESEARYCFVFYNDLRAQK
jgi:hypothetical protein